MIWKESWPDLNHSGVPGGDISGSATERLRSARREPPPAPPRPMMLPGMVPTTGKLAPAKPSDCMGASRSVPAKEMLLNMESPDLRSRSKLPLEEEPPEPEDEPPELLPPPPKPLKAKKSRMGVGRSVEGMVASIEPKARAVDGNSIASRSEPWREGRASASFQSGRPKPMTTEGLPPSTEMALTSRLAGWLATVVPAEKAMEKSGPVRTLRVMLERGKLGIVDGAVAPNRSTTKATISWVVICSMEAVSSAEPPLSPLVSEKVSVALWLAMVSCEVKTAAALALSSESSNRRLSNVSQSTPKGCFHGSSDSPTSSPAALLLSAARLNWTAKGRRAPSMSASSCPARPKVNVSSW